MSSVLAPNGLTPVAHFGGGIIRPDQSGLTIAYNYSTQIFTGDLVNIATGSGQIQQTAAGDSNGSVGVFMGCEFTNIDGRRRVLPYWPGANNALNDGTIVAYVITDPYVIYEIQGDASIAATAVGKQTRFTPGTGNTSSGASGGTLLTANLSASTASQLRVIGITNAPDNSWGDTYTRVRVLISLHQYVNRQGPF